jgi:putative phosphoribosyl transferase
VAAVDGRPDLIAAALPSVTTPTLLVVEGEEADILRVNRRALDLLPAAEKQLQLLPGGALDRTAALVRDWLIRVFHPAVGAVHAAPLPSQLG